MKMDNPEKGLGKQFVSVVGGFMVILGMASIVMIGVVVFAPIFGYSIAFSAIIEMFLIIAGSAVGRYLLKIASIVIWQLSTVLLGASVALLGLSLMRLAQKTK